MKKIAMFLFASFFIFSCSNSNTEQITEIEFDEEPQVEETGPSNDIKCGIENVEYIVRTGDFSKIDALIEENPKAYTYLLTRAAAKKRLGDIEGSNKDYDFALTHFDLPQADIDIINEQKNSKEDILKKYYQEN